MPCPIITFSECRDCKQAFHFCNISALLLGNTFPLIYYWILFSYFISYTLSAVSNAHNSRIPLYLIYSAMWLGSQLSLFGMEPNRPRTENSSQCLQTWQKNQTATESCLGNSNELLCCNAYNNSNNDRTMHIK